MANKAGFDGLVQKTIASDGAMEDLNTLYGHAFALPQWFFIARGELPQVNPYVASNAEYADGQHMVRAFTDTDRLLRFARENSLTDAEGGAAVLTIPTANIVDYLEQFMADGVHGIWFNSDVGSDGFFLPLKQLRPVKEYLERIQWQPSPKDFLSNEPPSTSELETVVRELAAGAFLATDFFLSYDDVQPMWGGVKITIGRDGSFERRDHTRGGLTSETWGRISADDFRGLAVLLNQIEVWKPLANDRPGVPGESQCVVTVRIGKAETSLSEWSNDLDNNQRAVKIRNRLLELTQPLVAAAVAPAETSSRETTATATVISQPGAPGLDLISPTYLAKLEAWLNGGARDDELAHYAFSRADEIFAGAGMKGQLPDEWRWKSANKWSFFCWHLARPMFALIDDKQYEALARTIFREFGELCLRVPSGQYAFPLAVLLNEYAEHGVLSQRLESLLPDVVQPEMLAVKALLTQWAQDAMKRKANVFARINRDINVMIAHLAALSRKKLALKSRESR